MAGDVGSFYHTARRDDFDAQALGRTGPGQLAQSAVPGQPPVVSSGSRCVRPQSRR
jgi:hypothetical protein